MRQHPQDGDVSCAMINSSFPAAGTRWLTPQGRSQSRVLSLGLEYANIERRYIHTQINTSTLLLSSLYIQVFTVHKGLAELCTLGFEENTKIMSLGRKARSPLTANCTTMAFGTRSGHSRWILLRSTKKSVLTQSHQLNYTSSSDI